MELNQGRIGLPMEAMLRIRLKTLKSRLEKHLSQEPEKLFPALGTGMN